MCLLSTTSLAFPPADNHHPAFSSSLFIDLLYSFITLGMPPKPYGLVLHVFEFYVSGILIEALCVFFILSLSTVYGMWQAASRWPGDVCLLVSCISLPVSTLLLLNIK